MQNDEFEFILDQQLAKSKATLSKKAEEYATNEDRLHNFKSAAHMKKTTLRDALGGMMVKHTTSIYDMIRDEEPHSIQQWNEKITDHINYLILLKAVVCEEQMETNAQLELDLEPEPAVKNVQSFSSKAGRPNRDIIGYDAEGGPIHLGEGTKIVRAPLTQPMTVGEVLEELHEKAPGLIPGVEAAGEGK